MASEKEEKPSLEPNCKSQPKLEDRTSKRDLNFGSVLKVHNEQACHEIGQWQWQNV